MYASVRTINTDCIQTNFGTYVFFLGWDQWTNIYCAAIHTQTHLQPTCEAQKAEYSVCSLFCEFVKNEAVIEMAAADHQNGGRLGKCTLCLFLFVVACCSCCSDLTPLCWLLRTNRCRLFSIVSLKTQGRSFGLALLRLLWVVRLALVACFWLFLCFCLSRFSCGIISRWSCNRR